MTNPCTHDSPIHAGECAECGDAVNIKPPVTMSAEAIRDAALSEFVIFAKSHYNTITAAFIAIDIARLKSRPAPDHFAAAMPDGEPVPMAESDAIRNLLAKHAALVNGDPYCYFELAYTRQTGWMAFICDRPAEGIIGTPEFGANRTILAQGQGDTPDEACNAATQGAAK
jgi:hypothetical protein